MCGISGIINTKPIHRHKDAREKILSLLNHRGPDANGEIEIENNLFFHTRLSIIDLNPISNQPFLFQDYIIIFNGECYNFLELKDDLISKGHKFKTASDTEVILKSYIEYGSDFTKKLNGMFAIAIYDPKLKVTLICRDHSGIKPLYYFQQDETFHFSSEIKPLLIFKKELNYNVNAIQLFLKYRFVPGEETLFSDIFSIPPGEIWIIDNNANIIKKNKFWDIDQIKIDKSISYNDFLSEYGNLLNDSCRLQNRSDVEVGVLLSGGIDSCTLASKLSQLSDNVNSYTLNMGTKVDEGELAKSVANHLKIKHHVLNFTSDDIKLFKKAIFHLETPLGDSIIAPTIKLFEGISKKNKVVLSGEGADEIMNGYVHHFALFYQSMIFKPLPNFLIRGLGSLANLVPQEFFEKIFPYPSKLGKSGTQKILNQISVYDGGYNSYSSLISMFQESDLKISTDSFSDPVSKHFQNSNDNFLSSITKADLKFWNVNYTLQRLDRLSMAYSVESRVPYLDHRLVKLCLQIPRKYLFRNFQQKVVLRDHLKKTNELPQQVYQRKKQPFYLPINEGLSSSISLWAKDYINSEFNHSIVSSDLIHQLLDIDKNELLDNKRFMALALLGLWNQEFKEFHQQNNMMR